MRSLLVLAALSTIAAAEPRFAVGLDYTIGRGGHVEELDLGMRLEAGLFVRVGRWQATLSSPVHPKITSGNVERDTDDVVGVGVSGRLGYRMPFFGGVLTLSGGMTRRWIYAQKEVRRFCGETGECIAGSYLEVPTYTAWAPQLRIGIGPDKVMRRMVLGASFELIVEAIGLHDVPPDGIRGVAVMGGVTLTIGGGPRKAQPAPPTLVGQNL